MINNEINYEEENEKLCFFLKKQSVRIKKLRTKCNGKNGCDHKKGDTVEKKNKG
tara:strand:- start:278 stop:439 length:162 start_codon:yes stop_codon:yes gene_type:complete